MVGGLVEDQQVRARRDHDRERQAPQLPARQDRDLLLRVVAREQEAARAARAPCPGSARWRAAPPPARCPARPISSACWERKPSSTLWPRRSFPRSQVAPRRRASRSASSCRRRWGPTSATCSPRSSHSSASSISVRPPTPIAASSSSSTTRPVREALPKRIAGPLPVGRVAARAARSCRAASPSTAPGASGCPARKRVTNRSSRSISACWRSIARPSASSRAARSLRHACHGPAKNRARPGLQLQHRRARPTRGTSGRGRPARSRRRARSAAARATRATRRRGGWWARRAAAGPGRRPACAPASRASALRPRTCAAAARGRRRRTRARARPPSRAAASRSPACSSRSCAVA